MSDADPQAMRDIVRTATVKSMHIVLADAVAAGRAVAGAEAVIAAMHEPGRARDYMVEPWLDLALALASISVAAGQKGPMVTCPEEAMSAALGMIDGFAEMARLIANGMTPGATADEEGAAHAVTH